MYDDDEDSKNHSTDDDSGITSAIVVFIIYLFIFETIAWLFNLESTWIYLLFLGLPFAFLVLYSLQYLINERPWRNFGFNKNFFRKLLLWLTFNFAYMCFSETRINFPLFLYINVSGLLYLVYLFDETNKLNIFAKLGIAVIYAWSLQWMYRTMNMNILSALLRGAGAIIPTIFATSLIEYLFFKGGIKDGLEAYIDYSKYSNIVDKEAEIRDLEESKWKVNYDVKIDRSTRNRIVNEIESEMEDKKRELEQMKKEIEDEERRKR